ncbi:MAG: AMP-binding protein [Erysipelothrix sp.]
MKNITQYLELTTMLYGNKKAIVCENKSLTYNEYLNHAQSSGTVFSKIMVPKSPIIIFMEKGPEALSLFMGVAYARCFYIFIDPKQHEGRIQQILDISNAKLMITHESRLPSTVHFSGKTMNYQDIISKEPDKIALDKIQSSALDTDPLYCNFTSGTTGVPKGVIVSHGSVIDFIDEFTPIFKITHNDIIGNQAPFDFDVSVKDIYSALSTGATLVVIPKKYFSVITSLMDYLVDNQVTTLIWAVSALSMLVQFKGLSYKVPTDVNKIMFSGEKMPLPILKKLQKALPESIYVNLYGPTEITCNCTYEFIPTSLSDDYVMPIGKSFVNEEVFLLDETNRLIVDYEKKGEICVIGRCLALGYYNNPEQTEKHFVQNPLNKVYPERMYRTGDLGYKMSDDKFYYAGRKDFQIKHMGHRIELEGIEVMAYQNTSVHQACCFYIEEKHQIILCYCGSIEATELKKYFIESVESYMVPTIIKQFESLPLNNNGKLDRKQIRLEYQQL